MRKLVRYLSSFLLCWDAFSELLDTKKNIAAGASDAIKYIYIWSSFRPLFSRGEERMCMVVVALGHVVRDASLVCGTGMRAGRVMCKLSFLGLRLGTLRFEQ